LRRGSTFPESTWINNVTHLETPAWLDTGDNAWQLTAASLVGLQSIPGLMVLYAGLVKKKWAINSMFMAFYGFAMTMGTCSEHRPFSEALR
jgi:Amt family ammonium transporter